MSGYRLGLIGAGNMAEAIARSAVEAGVLEAGQIVASDPSAERLSVFEAMGVAVTQENRRVVGESEQVMLAIKPQVLEAIAGDLSGLSSDQVLISIMAGLGTAKIAAVIGKPVRVVRVMPNTPVMVGKGMAGVCVGADTQAGDEDLAVRLFESGGEVVRVDESLMDAVTAVSGSGPAYLFYLAEAMIEAAGAVGIDADAERLVRQTIYGSAELLVRSDESAGELRRRVTSPGGTTAAAIERLEASEVRAAVVRAIQAARDRGRELGA
ncbi:pyrroline-5-carboxylate reductase [Mucisphaera calidilacus]|uniref:Pyrroline-5-carboxylate reductase n=1 Tax=Mucisphaera calidilacus TaxID=2527982 RepID=A0A518BXG3_9BACT|nr:pyrroline-5-carboxylate reductase [Mucisphaera calidilacus]QDU71646.1 Pyrroline-5-carboxylate reductase [Mucisphaera calidilacus]